MGWQIALCVLILLILPLLIPIGVSFVYSIDGPLVRILFGPIKFTVFPWNYKIKFKFKKKVKQKTSEPKPVQKPAEKKKVDIKQIGGLLEEFMPIFDLTLDMISAFRRKLRVNRLELDLVLAGDDPCDLALTYGRAWTALGNLMPHLERFLVIKKRDLNIGCDFTADATRVYVRFDITLTMGRALCVFISHGTPILRELLNIYNKRKGGSKL